MDRVQLKQPHLADRPKRPLIMVRFAPRDPDRLIATITEPATDQF
jgi:hypothetical protein